MTSEKRSGPRPVLYRGEPLDPERGPGLGCFWLQVAVLAVFIVLTPLSVAWGWPSVVSAALLFVVIGLLLVAGQTVIFLLRLVAAERRQGRHRPLAGRTPTIGEIEDADRPSHDEGVRPTDEAPANVAPAERGDTDSGDTESGSNGSVDGGVRE
jgi:hypothetical protein